MTEHDKEQYDRAMIAAINADRFGFVETAKSLRLIGRMIAELDSDAEKRHPTDLSQLMID